MEEVWSGRMDVRRKENGRGGWIGKLLEWNRLADRIGKGGEGRGRMEEMIKDNNILLY